MTEYETKRNEIDTANAVFCAVATCSDLIATKNISAGIRTCAACNEQTCTSCRNAIHDGLCHDGLCPEDVKDTLIKDIADEARWQQCGRCKNTVQLDVGCFHTA